MPRTKTIVLTPRRAAAPRRSAALLLAALSAASIATLATPATAQPGAAMPYVQVTDHNAALLYYNAWMSRAPDLDDAMESTDDGYVLVEGGHETLTKAADTIDALLRASRQDHADWEIEYELGPEALLPYLSKVRYTSKVFAADALRCAQDGDAAGAAERVAAIYRVADHLSGDRILISSLVGMAMNSFGNTIGAQLAQAGSLTPEAARSLLTAMRHVNVENPCGLRGAVIGERDIMGNYFIENFTGPDAGAWVMSFAPEMFDVETASSTSPVGEMSGAQLRRDIQGFRRFYDDTLAVWDQPNAADQITELSKGIETGEYGEFAKLFAASLSKSRQNMDRFRKDHAEAITQMQKTVNP
ncbi:MAG: hypothetical protein ACI89L_002667 [Phycisphaerales bacterium]|jgi:hypothetical protein